jgi:hypothetical protein
VIPSSHPESYTREQESRADLSPLFVPDGGFPYVELGSSGNGIIAEQISFFKLGRKVEDYPCSAQSAVNVIPIAAIGHHEFSTFEIKRQYEFLGRTIVSNGLGVFRKHQFKASLFAPNKVRKLVLELHYPVYGLIATFK